jgi:hypothetical protein
VDQAISLLTGAAAGQADASGEYPQGSINHKVAARVAELTEIQKKFMRPPDRKPEAQQEAD